MLTCDWFKNCHDNAAKVKLQNHSSQNRRQNFSFCSVVYLEKPCPALSLCSTFSLEKKMISVTPPNTEDILSQLAVIIKP